MGLRVLEVICLVFCLLSLLALTPKFLAPRHPTPLQYFVALLNIVIYAAAFYGIHMRKRLTWLLGWFGLGVFLVEWLAYCLVSSLRLPKPDAWIVFTTMVAVGLAVATYWGYWWKRQKN
jgi:hypothetical protein